MRNIIISNILFFVLLANAFSQEQLLPLQIDPDLNNFSQKNPITLKNQKLSEPMFLPFLDNFNQYSYRPDSILWLGDNVFVNKKFQLLPPDLGVATFDAMNGEGKIHDNASQFAFAADTLTSQPIRLDSIMDPILRPLLVRDSIYFSFYYQPQGKGNAPEEQDRLSLEFYSPSLDQWFDIWDSDGMKLDSFLVHTDSHFMQQVFIPILDSARFFHSGFQFRFHNIASLASSSQPDWQSNCDHWNIDFVRLDRDRTIVDSSFRKIAFVNEPPSMIKRYQQMPYRQYRNDPTNSMKDTLYNVYIRNLDDERYVGVYSYKIFNQSTQDSIYDGGSLTVFENTESNRGLVLDSIWLTPEVISYFSIYPSLQETFSIMHVVNDLGLTGIGDTAYRHQTFSNYYAYDDGTPEAGYGMSENNSKAVVQFKLNTKDTLTRVQMYFNPTLTSANENYFYLLVYKNIEPEELLYKKRFKVQFTDGYYNYHTFDLDTNLILANEFYVGFEQITDDNLNIGYDLSNNSGEYMFYNIGVGWEPSIYSGSLMLRPEFGVNELIGIESIKPVQESFSFYPNPAVGSYLNLDYSAPDPSNAEIEIFNITGQLLIRQRFDNQIDISYLDHGIYLLRLVDKANSQIITRKLLVQ
jgi:hypothetical protein